MCQFRITFYPCGLPFVKGSYYKLCADRPNCKKTIEMLEWHTFCPRMRKFLASAWNQQRQEEERYQWSPEIARRVPCCKGMDPQVFEGLCRKCNPAGAEQPGGFHRCSLDCQTELFTTKDPQYAFEWYIEKCWPHMPTARYEQRRDARDPTESEMWASSFLGE
ncbi:hypothetical protein PG985_005097 [Apiospora marii]|uniref:Uncharacterized protein n=1 Tax=Apiospora marii TaxID=335849 RepID=A0ABR1SB47_9PEZI